MTVDRAYELDMAAVREGPALAKTRNKPQIVAHKIGLARNIRVTLSKRNIVARNARSRLDWHWLWRHIPDAAGKRKGL